MWPFKKKNKNGLDVLGEFAKKAYKNNSSSFTPVPKQFDDRQGFYKHEERDWNDGLVVRYAIPTETMQIEITIRNMRPIVDCSCTSLEALERVSLNEITDKVEQFIADIIKKKHSVLLARQKRDEKSHAEWLLKSVQSEAKTLGLAKAIKHYLHHNQDKTVKEARDYVVKNCKVIKNYKPQKKQRRSK